MKKETAYKKAPADIAESILQENVVNDMLPPPDQLVFKEENERITINLTRSSIKFFRAKAQEMNIPYQRMIKQILDLYSKKYSNG